MRKKILLMSRHAPYGNSLAREAIDAALVCAAYDQQISLLFRDDGVFQLLDHQLAEKIRQKNFSSMIKSFEFYDLNDIYVHQESLNQRNINPEQLALTTIKMIDDSTLSELLAQQDQLLSF